MILSKRMKYFWKFSGLFRLALLAMTIWGLSCTPTLVNIAKVNLGNLLLTRGLLRGEPVNSDGIRLLKEVAPIYPQAYWGLAFYSQGIGNRLEQTSYLVELLRYRFDRAILVRVIRPDDPEMAMVAWEYHPERSFSQFWLGEALIGSDPKRAAVLYQEGLEQVPFDGERWVELGWIYRRIDLLEDALLAYREGCRWKDRGGNGCWQAGQLAQQMGRIGEARYFYEETLQQIPGYTPALERLNSLHNLN